MKFTDLDFKNHAIYGENSLHALAFFPNGYGISVVQFPGSYGYEDGLYEVAVLKGTPEDYELCYDTPITDDILGHRDETDIDNILEEVEALWTAKI